MVAAAEGARRRGDGRLLPGRRRSEPPAIVVPVYNAAEHVPACLEAIRRNTDSPYRLIVIDDASPDPEIARDLLDGSRDWPEFEVRRNAENLGFTRTVNLRHRARRARRRHLPQFRHPGHAGLGAQPASRRLLRHRIGDREPFSNNAGAFSAPAQRREQPLPEWLSLDD